MTDQAGIEYLYPTGRQTVTPILPGRNPLYAPSLWEVVQ